MVQGLLGKIASLVLRVRGSLSFF